MVDGDISRACEALREAGLGEMVQPRFNTNTLSAYLRELHENGQPLPKQLVGAIEANRVFKVGVRRGSR